MVSIASRAMPRRSSPTSEDAPQSIRKFALSPATWKQVASRPPEPNASPQPTNCRCMAKCPRGSAPGAPGEPKHQPDRHHDDGAEQEIAPHPHDGVEPHVPDRARQPLDAAPDVARIEPERRED